MCSSYPESFISMVVSNSFEPGSLEAASHLSLSMLSAARVGPDLIYACVYII